MLPHWRRLSPAQFVWLQTFREVSPVFLGHVWVYLSNSWADEIAQSIFRNKSGADSPLDNWPESHSQPQVPQTKCVPLAPLYLAHKLHRHRISWAEKFKSFVYPGPVSAAWIKLKLFKEMSGRNDSCLSFSSFQTLMHTDGRLISRRSLFFILSA